MATPRFLVPELRGRPPGATFALPADVSHHASRVLRLRVDDPLVLFDGSGGEHHAQVIAAGPPMQVRLDRFDPIERESPLDLTLVQAMVASEKLDWLVEKATELGAARIVIVDAERSVVRLTGERLERRLARWREIAIAACCQCGRNLVPVVIAAPTLAAALDQMSGAECWLLAPDAAERLRLGATSARRIAALVGPEGGWSDGERALALAAGCREGSLGPRVFRTETAGLALLAAAQAWAGDF